MVHEFWVCNLSKDGLGISCGKLPGAWDTFLHMKNAEGSGVSTSWYRRELHGPWRVLGIVLTVLVVCWIGLGLYRIPAVKLQQKSEATVALIQAQKLTMNDVDGKHLPPEPSQKDVNATIAGVDANANDIRDDVELAIFAKYPNDIRVRAAELQYAMNEEVMLTRVFSVETWVATAQNLSRSSACVYDVFPQNPALATKEISQLQKLVLNTKQRVGAKDEAYKFTTSYGDNVQADCDINLNLLAE